MTEESGTTGATMPPGAPVDPAVADPAVTTPARKSGGRGAVIIVVAIVAFLAIVLFAVRNNVSADDLKVGDCFTIPNGTTVQTVETRPCTESHNAEVVFVGDHDGTTFPISLSLDSFVEDNCVPAFEGYLGRTIDSEPELSVGYFHPTREGWDSGDRAITCYISQPDESAMTESLKQ